MTKVLIAVLMAAALAAGETAVQTDWSTGPGEPGPVLEWGTSFCTGSSVDYQSQTGSISILWGKLTDFGWPVQGSQQYAIGAYSGDVDLDGDLDILTASSVDNKLMWWENLNGSATSWSGHLIASELEGAWGAACSDIDQDGDTDVFSSAMGDGVVVWMENTDGSGLTWIMHSIDDSLAGAKAICVIDLDGDGLDDVAAAAKTDDVIVWYENPGSGSVWTKHTIVSDYDGANSVYPADFDGDGDMDMLAAAKSAKAVRWYENNGSGAGWTEHSIADDLDLARTAEAADFDGDGDMDAVGAGGISKASGRVCWWENADGLGSSWIEHNLNDDFQGPYTVLQQDLDNDGDQDILAGSLTFNGIYWWENTGPGGDWPEHLLCGYYAPRTVSVADLDGDGALEVFAGSLYGFEMMIWEIMGYGTAGLVSSILDTRGDSQWTDLSWTTQQPAGTTVGISVRSSWDEDQMGDWSDTVYTSPVDPSILMDDSERFVQYSVILSSDDPDLTPVMESISLSWNPLGITGQASSTAAALDPVNPSEGSLTLMLTLPQGVQGELEVFELSGRMIHRSNTLTGTGMEEVYQVENLVPGVYFSRLLHSGESILSRSTVIR